MSAFQASKYVNALPGTLAASTVYFVRSGSGFDIFVTNESGLVVAYPLNQVTASVDSREGCFETDFMHTNAVQRDFIMAAFGTGPNFTTAAVAGSVSPNHKGVVQWRSGTTASSGINCFTAPLTAYRLGGGEQWDVNFFTAPVFTTVTFRSGALDSTTVTAPVDGMYLEMTANGNIVGKCRNNNTESVTATLATLAASTWYHGRITLNAAATITTFTVFSDAGVQLGQATLSTNIPTAAGRETAWGTIALSSGTVAIELCHMDRQKLGNPGRIVQRGAA